MMGREALVVVAKNTSITVTCTDEDAPMLMTSPFRHAERYGAVQFGQQISKL